MATSRWTSRLLRLQQRPQVVEGGQVNCELRNRDVEIDECASCPWLVDMDGKGDEPYVMCSPQAGYHGLKGLGI